MLDMWPDLTKVPGIGSTIASSTTTAPRVAAKFMFDGSTVMINTLNAAAIIGWQCKVALGNFFETNWNGSANSNMSATPVSITYLATTDAMYTSIMARPTTQASYYINNLFTMTFPSAAGSGCVGFSYNPTDSSQNAIASKGGVCNIITGSEVWAFVFNAQGQIQGLQNMWSSWNDGTGSSDMVAQYSASYGALTPRNAVVSASNAFFTILIPGTSMYAFQNMDLSLCCTGGFASGSTQYSICTSLGLAQLSGTSAPASGNNCLSLLLTGTTAFCPALLTSASDTTYEVSIGTSTQTFDQTGCFQICKQGLGGADCDAWLGAWCAGSTDRLNANPNTCGCYMGQAYYDKFFQSMVAAGAGGI